MVHERTPSLAVMQLFLVILISSGSSDQRVKGWHGESSQQAMAGVVAVAYMFTYMLMCVVREPSVPKRDRDGKSIVVSYPIHGIF